MSHTGYRRNGWSIRELSEKTGASTRTIERWTSKPRDPYLSRAATRGEQIQRLHQQGLTMRAIAAEVGLGVGTVHRWVKRLAEAS